MNDLSGPASPPELTRAADRQQYSSAGKLILLAEDNEHDEELVLRALRKSNVMHETAVVRDGAEALDYLFATGKYAGSSPVLPNVMFLDVKLPKIDGLEVLRRIRENERTKLIPVVVLTSSKQDKDRLVAYTNGANSFVRKPIEFAEFSDAIRHLALYWLTLNEPPPLLSA